MKKTLGALAVSGVIFFGAMHAEATTYEFIDNYVGGSLPDSIGGNKYDLEKTIVTVNNSQLVFDIYSRNSGGYFTVGFQFYGLGDLFLDTKGGASWDYVVDLSASPGPATLYAVDPAKIVNGIERSQAALYNPGSQSVVTNSIPGSWAVKTTNDADRLYKYLSITIPLPQSVWDGTTPLGFHWTMTCGNDVVQDVLTPVPEPATMLLFGTGLVGLAGFARRRAR